MTRARIWRVSNSAASGLRGWGKGRVAILDFCQKGFKLSRFVMKLFRRLVISQMT